MGTRPMPRLAKAWESSVGDFERAIATSRSTDLAGYIAWCRWDREQMAVFFSPRGFPHFVRAVASEWGYSTTRATDWFAKALGENNLWSQVGVSGELNAFVRLLGPEAAHRLLSTVIEEIRERVRPHLSGLRSSVRILRWTEILTEAAATAPANDLLSAVSFHSEIDELLPQVTEPGIAAGIAGRNAVQFAFLIAGTSLISERWIEARERIHAARERFSRCEQHDAIWLLRLALAEEELLRRASSRNLLGRFPADEESLIQLADALAVLAQAFLPSVDKGLEELLYDLTGAVPAKYAKWTAQALNAYSRVAGSTGRSALALQASSASFMQADSPLGTLDALSEECCRSSDVQRMTDLAEEILRMSARLELPQRLLKESSSTLHAVGMHVRSAFTRVADLLVSTHPVASKFWEREASKLVLRGPGGRWTSRPRNPASVPWTEARIRAVVSRCEECVRNQDPAGLVVAMRKASTVPEENWSDDTLLRLEHALERIDAYNLPRRSSEYEKLSLQGLRRNVMRARLLQLTYSYAVAYAPDVAARVLASLARSPSVDVLEGAKLARRAAETARDRGDWIAELDAVVGILPSLQINSSNHIEMVRRICDLADIQARSGTRSLSALEVSRHISTQLRTICRSLVASGSSPELAFEVGSRVTGRFLEALVQNADTFHEYELLEQYDAHQKMSKPLFRLMKRRIVEGLDSDFSSKNLRRDLNDVHLPGDTAIAQIMAAGHGTTVLLLFWRDGKRTYRSISLENANSRTWSRRVWWQMEENPDRQTRDLGLIHSEIVKPILDEVGPVNSLIFVVDPELSTLPLHAARSNGLYLIETTRVTYAASIHSLRPTRVMEPSRALVAAWDEAVHADVEAEIVTPLMEQAGIQVYRPVSAEHGKALLLDRDVSVGAIHFAGHCSYKEWPSTSASELHLNQDIRISVSDWLRSGCQAQFVFIDACQSARYSADAKDRTGFPLAFGARGATTAVVAMDDVFIESAHLFAGAFYSAWRSSDSIEAFQTACINAIRSGRGEPAWVPYIHDGPGLSMSLQQKEEPKSVLVSAQDPQG